MTVFLDKEIKRRPTLNAKIAEGAYEMELIMGQEA